MERLEILPSQLRATAESMTAAAEGIEAELLHLGDQLDALRLEWQGEAHAAFDHAQTQARHDLNAQKDILHAIAEMAMKRAEGYGAVDRDAARVLGGQE